MEQLKITPKVVFLDWYGTLSSSNFWWPQEDENDEKHFIAQAVTEHLFGELREKLNPWMRGELTTEAVLKELSAKSGIAVKILTETLEESCRTMKYTSDRIIPLVDEIRSKGIKVVIATDNMDTFNRWTAPALQPDKQFDGILNSYNLGVRKTDVDQSGRSTFFTKYLHSIGCTPENTIIFDDSIDKNNAIQNTGIAYVKIEPHVGLEQNLDKLLKQIDESRLM